MFGLHCDWNMRRLCVMLCSKSPIIVILTSFTVTVIFEITHWRAMRQTVPLFLKLLLIFWAAEFCKVTKVSGGTLMIVVFVSPQSVWRISSRNSVWISSWSSLYSHSRCSDERQKRWLFAIVACLCTVFRTTFSCTTSLHYYLLLTLVLRLTKQWH